MRSKGTFGGVVDKGEGVGRVKASIVLMKLIIQAENLLSKIIHLENPLKCF